MKLVGLTAGHNAKDSGAVRDPVQENLLTLQTLGYAMSYLASREIYTVSPTGKLSSKILELNRYKLACAVEIHYNAFSNTTVKGVESIYHPGSVKGLRLAEGIYNEMTDLPFLSPRKVVHTKELGRRLAFTREVSAPAVIIEPLWISNPDERAAVEDPDKVRMIGHAVAKAIINFLSWSTE